MPNLPRPMSDGSCPALPAIALHRGLLPLHASAVARNGDVHAFSGGTAEGKSTLAAAMPGPGYGFFADDILIFDPVRDAGSGSGVGVGTT